MLDEDLNMMTFASFLIARQTFESSLPWLMRHTHTVDEADEADDSYFHLGTGSWPVVGRASEDRAP